MESNTIHDNTIYNKASGSKTNKHKDPDDKKRKIPPLNNFAIGSKIRYAREMKQISPEDLSYEVGYELKSLMQVETGRRSTSMPAFVSVCNKLEVSPEFLLASELKPNIIKLGTKYKTLFDKVQLMSDEKVALMDDFADMLLKPKDKK